jgi:tripartite-type tricarboxylate transporter receptor subunit TctC
MRIVQSATPSLLLFIVAGTSSAAVTAIAQAADSYPARPVRMIVPLSAGSAADVLARRLASKLSESWGQQVIVDNRTGAGGTIGTGIVARSVPDGYTLLTHSAAFAVSAALYPKLPYDPLRDLTGVSQMAMAPIVLVIAPSLGTKSVVELLALAKQKPGQLAFASSGIGSSTHFAGEQFRIAASINVVHVPYKGPSEALVDTATGRIQFFLAPVVPALPFIRDGRLLPLAVTTAKRTPVLPDVPTIADSGLANYEYLDWWGLFAPSRTSRFVIDKLSRDTARILENTEIREQMLSQGAEATSSTPDEFERFVRSKIESAGKLVKVAGIHAE